MALAELNPGVCCLHSRRECWPIHHKYTIIILPRNVIQSPKFWFEKRKTLKGRGSKRRPDFSKFDSFAAPNNQEVVNNCLDHAWRSSDVSGWLALCIQTSDWTRSRHASFPISHSSAMRRRTRPWCCIGWNSVVYNTCCCDAGCWKRCNEFKPRGVIWGAGGPSPPPPTEKEKKEKKEREKEKRERKEKKREEGKKETMNSVKLLHIQCCFFQFLNSPVALKYKKKFGPQEKVEMTPLFIVQDAVAAPTASVGRLQVWFSAVTAVDVIAGATAAAPMLLLLLLLLLLPRLLPWLLPLVPKLLPLLLPLLPELLPSCCCPLPGCCMKCSCSCWTFAYVTAAASAAMHVPVFPSAQLLIQRRQLIH